MKLWCCLTITVLLVMLLSGHLSSTTSLWFTHEVDPKVHDQSKMLQETEHGTDATVVKAFINISSTSICAFDRLIIDWFIDLGQASSEDEQSIGDIVLSFHKDGHYEAHSIALASVSNEDDATVTKTHSLNTTNGLIRCELNEIHCVPTVASVIAVVESNRLAILFSEATNQPSLSSLSAIDKAFSFHPRLSGVAMGHWVTSQRLEIEMDKQVLNKILLDYQIGSLIQIFPRTVVPRSIWSGRSSIRPTQHGQYRAFFMDLKRDQVLFPGAMRPVLVSICDDYVPVPTIPWSESGRKEASLSSTDGMVVGMGEEYNGPPSPKKRPGPPKASWHVRGTTAITGLSPITIEHGALQELAVGTWSLSCWVRIIEPPTGSFRSLMYKGDANGNSRTPSIWLHPDSNRLSIRVSTVDTPDIGADSIETLPMNDWVFVTVVFMNYTAASMDTSISDEHADVEVERNETEDLLHGIQVQYPSARRRRTRHAPSPSDSGSGYQYSISLFINGHLDISMEFTAVVASNPHPLQLFKDVSHRGPKLLLRHLTVWSCDLSAEEVMAKYLRGHASSEGVSGGIDAILNVFKRSGSGLVYEAIPPTVERDSLLDGDGIDLPAVTGGPFMFSGVRLDEGDFGSSASIPPDPLAAILLEKARISLANCDSYSRRLDLYAEAAERGSAEALYLWGMMVKYGTEAANTHCGSSNTDDGIGRSSFVGSTSSAIKSLLQGSTNHGFTSGGWTEADDRSTYAFLVAADMGHAAALVPLAFSLLHGIGAGPLMRNPLARVSVSLNIPLHPSFIAAASDGSAAFYRLTKLHFMMSKALLQQGRPNDRDDQVISETRKEKAFPLASSVVDDDSHLSVSVTNSRCEEMPSSSEGGSRSEVDTTCCIGDEDHFPYIDATSLAIGMLHIAALHSIPEAHKALAYRYKHGMGVPADIETAVYYLKLPTAVTNDEFHRIGGQPVVEADRINDKTAPVVSRGNHGDDDELIQHQKVRAQEGHLPSMLAMGDLYYYGARGLPRDQSMALRYFEQAADRHGDPTGMCAAAGMYLKGEGADKNVSRAISLYENASSTGSIRALNGLGYMYHFGQSVPKNSSKAFQYFLMAASFETDADSIFNAGHCLEHGLGTEVDLSRAVEFYSIAANKLGNFDSIQALGNMYLEGRGVTRSAQSAWFYLNSATDIGPWSGWLRRGLDRYLHDQFPLALSCYLHGGELGFEVSQSNAAYILRTKMSSSKSLISSSNSLAATTTTTTAGIRSPSKTSACFGDNPGSRYCSTRAEASDDGWWRGRLLVRQYELSSHHGNRESMLHLGNCFFKGHCGKSGPDYPSSVYYYSKAAQLGDPMSSAYLSIMHHFGIGVPVNQQRAQRYYDLAVQSKADHQDLLILQALKYALSLNSYSMLMPVNYIADYVVRVLWSII